MDDVKVCKICEEPETATKVLAHDVETCDDCWNKMLEFVQSYTRAMFIKRYEVVPDITQEGLVRIRRPTNAEFDFFECDCGWETKAINRHDITKHIEEHVKKGDKPW